MPNAEFNALSYAKARANGAPVTPRDLTSKQEVYNRFMDEGIVAEASLTNPELNDPNALSRTDIDQGHEDFANYLNQRPTRAPRNKQPGVKIDPNTGAGWSTGYDLDRDLGKHYKDTLKDSEHNFEAMPDATLIKKWAEAEDNNDQTTASDIQDVLQERLVKSKRTDEEKMSDLDDIISAKDALRKKKNAKNDDGTNPEDGDPTDGEPNLNDVDLENELGGHEDIANRFADAVNRAARAVNQDNKDDLMAALADINAIKSEYEQLTGEKVPDELMKQIAKQIGRGEYLPEETEELPQQPNFEIEYDMTPELSGAIEALNVARADYLRISAKYGATSLGRGRKLEDARKKYDDALWNVGKLTGDQIDAQGHDEDVKMMIGAWGGACEALKIAEGLTRIEENNAKRGKLLTYFYSKWAQWGGEGKGAGFFSRGRMSGNAKKFAVSMAIGIPVGIVTTLAAAPLAATLGAGAATGIILGTRVARGIGFGRLNQNSELVPGTSGSVAEAQNYNQKRLTDDRIDQLVAGEPAADIKGRFITPEDIYMGVHRHTKANRMRNLKRDAVAGAASLGGAVIGMWAGHALQGHLPSWLGGRSPRLTAGNGGGGNGGNHIPGGNGGRGGGNHVPGGNGGRGGGNHVPGSNGGRGGGNGRGNTTDYPKHPRTNWYPDDGNHAPAPNGSAGIGGGNAAPNPSGNIPTPGGNIPTAPELQPLAGNKYPWTFVTEKLGHNGTPAILKAAEASKKYGIEFVGHGGGGSGRIDWVTMGGKSYTDLGHINAALQYVLDQEHITG